MYELVLQFLTQIFGLMYSVLTEDLSDFSPHAYEYISILNTILKGFASSLMLVAFCVGYIQSAVSLIEQKTPIAIFKTLARLVIVNALVVRGTDIILMPMFSVVRSLTSRLIEAMGGQAGLLPNIDESSPGGVAGAIGELLSMEIYTAGSYDMFAQSTNVDTQAHIIDYDLSKLGEGMNAVGMLIVLESIYSRLMDNWRKKRHTYIYIDEIMTIFRNPYAAQYFASLWQRIRKRGGYIIGATQNTTEILNSPEARKLLENSYIITMLYQSAPDRDVLAEMFSLSEAQKQALAKEQYGTGLIKVGSTIVPFENDFPTDNPLYQLMSTKPSDGWGQEVNEHYDV